jgi:hypothetical protein
LVKSFISKIEYADDWCNYWELKNYEYESIPTDGLL